MARHSFKQHPPWWVRPWVLIGAFTLFTAFVAGSGAAAAFWMFTPQAATGNPAAAAPGGARPDTARQPASTVSRERPPRTPSASDWPMYRRSADHSADHPRAGLDRTTAARLTQRWHAHIPGTITSPLVAAGGSIYAGSDDRHLYALDATSGAIQWRAPVGGTVMSSPAVVDDRIIFTASDGSLTALKTTSGHRLWSHSGHYGTSSPVITAPGPQRARPQIYVGSTRGAVDALDLNGRLTWSRSTGGPVRSSPAVAGGTVYVGADDKILYALDAATGVPRWQQPTAGSIEAAPAVQNAMVYVGSTDSTMYAFDAGSGRPVWTHRTHGPLRSSPAVTPARGGASGTLYVSSDDGTLYAFDAATGTTRWKTPLQATTSPAHANDLLILGTATSLTVLDARNGTRLWGTTLAKPTVTSPILARGKIIIGTAQGHLYGFAPPTVHKKPPTPPATPKPATALTSTPNPLRSPRAPAARTPLPFRNPADSTHLAACPRPSSPPMPLPAR
ncbi:PQQ-binding-like beta-propeller repeat protein [Streptomyces sp. MNP-20]|uniref:outer membrane protein assembly factor BamB family protein n=1 Tax=Streptomyces sp. MNP-20 TaxID=2721165 RepID=UPI00155495A1|nr:PQQ-binding-like beta-propeller repeat protein [Streptomyces sp. MNP-20]